MLTAQTVNSLVQTLEPDVKALVNKLSHEETWVHVVEDIPQEIRVLGESLPQFVRLPVSPEHNQVIDRLIQITAHLDIRLWFAVIIFLEKGVLALEAVDKEPGWGSYLLVRAEQIAERDSQRRPEAITIIGRLHAAVRHMLLVDMLLDQSTIASYREAMNA